MSARSARQRELGQNFLVDRNILDVIERLAELRPDDVVLEVGGGPGVLSERLAARSRDVHVVEIDERLERPSCATRWRASTTSTLHFADALELDLPRSTRPRQDRRQPALRDRGHGDPATIEELPSVPSGS